MVPKLFEYTNGSIFKESNKRAVLSYNTIDYIKKTAINSFDVV